MKKRQKNKAKFWLGYNKKGRHQKSGCSNISMLDKLSFDRNFKGRDFT
jgi:hypothetical protein